MTFGMAVGLERGPVVRTPADHLAVRDELLYTRQAAGHASEALRLKYGLHLRGVDQTMRAKESLDGFGTCPALASQQTSRQIVRSFRHEHRHSMSFLQPRRQPDVIGMY